MDVRLLVAHSKAEKKQIRLGAETLIGRSPECNLRIASGQVSRRHCLIKVEETTVSVRDLGSVNGTRLNGQTIDSELDVPVPPGSTLVVGPLKFVVQFTIPRPIKTDKGAGSTAEVPETARDFEAMATVPVVDGEETKDYPPTRGRSRGAPPPLEVSGEPRAPGPDSDDHHRVARTTEADIASLGDETVFDVALDAGPQGAGAGESRAPIGSETDLVFDEDELSQLAAAVNAEAEAQTLPEIDPAAGARDASGESNKPQDGGWHLIDMLRKKKKPQPPHAETNLPDDPSSEELRRFLDDA